MEVVRCGGNLFIFHNEDRDPLLDYCTMIWPFSVLWWPFIIRRGNHSTLYDLPLFLSLSFAPFLLYRIAHTTRLALIDFLSQWKGTSYWTVLPFPSPLLFPLSISFQFFSHSTPEATRGWNIRGQVNKWPSLLSSIWFNGTKEGNTVILRWIEWMFLSLSLLFINLTESSEDKEEDE